VIAAVGATACEADGVGNSFGREVLAQGRAA
jgi:hypothetical protein